MFRIVRSLKKTVKEGEGVGDAGGEKCASQRCLGFRGAAYEKVVSRWSIKNTGPLGFKSSHAVPARFLSRNC
jgi:hypothetical protein